MSYEKARRTASQFKALTSLTPEQFDLLLPIFEAKWALFIDRFNLDGTPRVRKYVPRNEQQLPTVADKLFFILFYKKTNSLQEVVASYFDLDVSMSNKWIHILSPILEKALENYAPKARLENVPLTAGETYIIDGSERPIQRDTYDQREFYSGKKGTHTVKNILLISILSTILWLSPTYSGRQHDKKLVESLVFTTPITVLADLGFLAWKTENVCLQLPHKKPRNTKTEKRELTIKQKEENQVQASKRVRIENVLAHVKILRIVKDRNRNYRFNFRDRIMWIACSLYNFRRAHPGMVYKKEIVC